MNSGFWRLEAPPCGVVRVQSIFKQPKPARLGVLFQLFRFDKQGGCHGVCLICIFNI